MKVTYNSNNSGGSWWLKDEDWFALEQAGWTVEWVLAKETWWEGLDHQNPPHPTVPGKFTWLGAIAKSASLECETPADAMRAFESVTKQDVMDEGCNCCGAPHGFRWDGGYAAGEDCREHLFGSDTPRTLREALERRKR